MGFGFSKQQIPWVRLKGLQGCTGVQGLGELLYKGLKKHVGIISGLQSPYFSMEVNVGGSHIKVKDSENL